MQKLQKEHDMGILFITHDLGVIAELADKVVVMYKGKIVEQGAVWDIFNEPKHPYTKGLLACRSLRSKSAINFYQRWVILCELIKKVILLLMTFLSMISLKN